MRVRRGLATMPTPATGRTSVPAWDDEKLLPLAVVEFVFMQRR